MPPYDSYIYFDFPLITTTINKPSIFPTFSFPSIRLLILSDIHLESSPSYDTFPIPSNGASYLALLGDIGNTKDPTLFSFLTKQLSRFEKVFFVLGNHEPYHSSFPAAISAVEEFAAKQRHERKLDPWLGEFVFLDRTRYDVSDSVTILGCTLFSNVTPEQRDTVGSRLNDFGMIEGWSVEQHNEAHRQDVGWLDSSVETIEREEPQRKIVILTHHAPTVDERTVDPSHTRSTISSGFSTDLREHLCWKSDKVKVWAFGHTHDNCDYVHEATGKRVVTNQRGYSFSKAQGYEEGKVIEL